MSWILKTYELKHLDQNTLFINGAQLKNSILYAFKFALLASFQRENYFDFSKLKTTFWYLQQNLSVTSFMKEVCASPPSLLVDVLSWHYLSCNLQGFFYILAEKHA